MAARLNIETTFHKLRHYSATELIISGVDVRTVAGRLGHSGGGTTTLRTYTAWVSEAASGIGARMPSRPDPNRRMPEHEPPYLKIAAELRRRILANCATDRPRRRRRRLPPSSGLPSEFADALGSAATATDARYWSVILRGPDGHRYAPRLAPANLADPLSFHTHLVGIARVEDAGRTDNGETWIGNYELEIYEPGSEQRLLTLRY
jgi:integrase